MFNYSLAFYDFIKKRVILNYLLQDDVMICGSHGISPASPQGPLQLLFGFDLVDSGTQNGEKWNPQYEDVFLTCSYASHQENKK